MERFGMRGRELVSRPEVSRDTLQLSISSTAMHDVYPARLENSNSLKISDQPLMDPFLVANVYGYALLSIKLCGRESSIAGSRYVIHFNTHKFACNQCGCR